MRANKAFLKSACNENYDSDPVFEEAALVIHAILLSASCNGMLQDFDIGCPEPDEKCVAQTRRYILKGAGFNLRHTGKENVSGDIMVELKRYIPDLSREMDEPYALSIMTMEGRNIGLSRSLPHSWIPFHSLEQDCEGEPMQMLCETLRTALNHLKVKTEFLMETRLPQPPASWKPKVI